MTNKLGQKGVFNYRNFSKEAVEFLVKDTKRLFPSSMTK